MRSTSTSPKSPPPQPPPPLAQVPTALALAVAPAAALLWRWMDLPTLPSAGALLSVLCVIWWGWPAGWLAKRKVLLAGSGDLALLL